MDIKKAQSFIIDRAKGLIPSATLKETSIHQCSGVNFYVLNSQFECIADLKDVSRNMWKKTYQSINDEIKDIPSSFTNFILVVDKNDEDNILYCNKVK